MFKSKITFIVVILFFFGSLMAIDFTKYEVSILWKGVIIGTPYNLNIWNVSTWSEIIYAFTGYFWIEDLRWTDTWHYTTIQLDWLYGPSNSVITWVELKYTNLELLNGSENSTLINTDASNWLDITTPKLFFYRNDFLSNWAINKYGTKPSIKITVPDDAQAGIYRWKIIYTLYDYWVSVGN